MHIHIENDPAGPDALQLPQAVLMQRLEANPALRGRFTLSENSDPQRVADFLPAADIVWAGRKFPLYQHLSSASTLGWVQVMSAGVEAGWRSGQTRCSSPTLPACMATKVRSLF